MTTRNHTSLMTALLLALGAPQLAACESSHAAASDELARATGPDAIEATSRSESLSPHAAAAVVAPSVPLGVAPPEQERTPAPAPAATARSSAAASSGALGVRRLVVAHQVVEREPLGAEQPFVAGRERVYAFVEARNGDSQARALSVVFEGPGGRRVGHVALSVPARQGRFRTWAYTRFIDTPGTWQASVLAEDGSVLASETFEVR